MECEILCDDDEIEVEVEGECCPVCMADWVTAVNPAPEGSMGEPLDLTCKVEGVKISADNVKWYKFNPGNDDVGLIKKHYSLSANGLILTINKMNDWRVGQYKCVV